MLRVAFVPKIASSLQLFQCSTRQRDRQTDRQTHTIPVTMLRSA